MKETWKKVACISTNVQFCEFNSRESTKESIYRITLIYMFYDRTVNKKYITYMKVVYKLCANFYYLFCIHDKFFTVHQRNIQSMAIELLKVKQNLSNSMLCDIFQTRSLSYNLRTQIDFLRSIAPPSLVDTGRTFNVHKTSWTFSECLIYVNLRPVSTGPALAYTL